MLDRRPSALPVDLEAIARAEGAVVRTEELDPEVSGFLALRDGRAIIATNALHRASRRRFTLAHELGHLLLHHRQSALFLDAAPVFFRSDGPDRTDGALEREANVFAAELLMPAESVRQVMADDPIDVQDDDAVKQMAERFGVSGQALAIRLAELDLLVP